MTPPAVMWFRRDLRLGDHPALLAAADSGEVLPLFVLDDRLLEPAGEPRRRFLRDCLRALDHDLGGRLHVVSGDPAHVVPEIARTGDTTQYGNMILESA